MNKKKRLVGLSVLVFALIVGLAYAVPYGVRTLYQAWTEVESEDTRIQLTAMDCDFFEDLNFTYTLTFENMDSENNHSAKIDFKIFNGADDIIFEQEQIITELIELTSIDLTFYVELEAQEDINEHEYFKIGVCEGLE